MLYLKAKIKTKNWSAEFETVQRKEPSEHIKSHTTFSGVFGTVATEILDRNKKATGIESGSCM